MMNSETNFIKQSDDKQVLSHRNAIISLNKARNRLYSKRYYQKNKEAIKQRTMKNYYARQAKRYESPVSEMLLELKDIKHQLKDITRNITEDNESTMIKKYLKLKERYSELKFMIKDKESKSKN